MSTASISAASSQPPLSLSMVVETPENVRLTYQLAGPASRLGALLLDLTVQWIIVALCIVFALIFSVISAGLSSGVLLMLLFVVQWFYFALLEAFLGGRTIGKIAFKLRVIHDGGYPLSFWGAVLRNFLRTADSIPGFGAGFLAMATFRGFRRLGDLAARTLVIEERITDLPREPIILSRIQPLPRGEIGSYRPPERVLALIEQFLGRRHVLSYQRGHELARLLAQALVRRMRYQGDASQVHEYPMAFLARVYATFYNPDEWQSAAEDAGRSHPVAKPGAEREALR